MILALANLFVNLLGFDFERGKKYARILFLVAVAVVVIVPTVFIYRACNKPAKLDEKQIQKVQKAIAKADRAEMEQTLVESRLAEQQIIEDTEEAEVIKEQTVKDARKEAEAMTNKELAEALEGMINR
jgi:preprotein translocase subunit SecF